MTDITLSDLCDNFKNAIIIDNDKKVVWVIKDGNGKIYSKDYYEELVKKIGGVGWMKKITKDKITLLDKNNKVLLENKNIDVLFRYIIENKLKECKIVDGDDIFDTDDEKIRIQKNRMVM